MKKHMGILGSDKKVEYFFASTCLFIMVDQWIFLLNQVRLDVVAANQVVLRHVEGGTFLPEFSPHRLTNETFFQT